MASRMDRYKTDENDKDYSRSVKNKKLYNSIDKNTTYATLKEVRTANTYSINNPIEQSKTREGYHKIKDYEEFVPQQKIKKELNDINYLYEERGNKVYDINTFLQDAKKSRNASEIDEEKRKISNDKYAITKEEIEKYRKEKKNRTKPDKEKMKELINTITTRTLRGELDQATSVDLLSDLMATSEMDKVSNSGDIFNTSDLAEVKEKIDDYKENDSITTPIEMKDMDPSFYTKSMDLSDKDFLLDDEDEEKEKKVPAIFKFFLIILLLALLGVLIYFIIQSF